MSRIDDDIDDRRAAEYLQQQMQQAELVAKKKQVDGSEFDRRMADSMAQRGVNTQMELKKNVSDLEAAREPRGADVLREAKEKARAGDSDATRQLEGHQQAERQVLQGKGEQGKLKELAQRKSQDASLLLTRQMGTDQSEGQRSDRRVDANQSGRALLDSKHESAEKKKEQADTPTAHTGDKKEEHVHERDGREGSQKGGSGGDKGGEPPPNFRLNPALLAPPPLARPKDDARTEKLRKLANEIAQKIVEKARVGRNALGQAEFQLDLRSNVLSGLQINVSASGGRISALFKGSDRKVLAMLRENADSLKASLQSRGLTLENLRIEATG